jgi:FkbM family methyltransferase
MLNDLNDLANIELLDFKDMRIAYRKETTDLNCLKEVLMQKCYQSKKHNFYVEKGEHWLDLGGNIGAFGLFVLSQGGQVSSYEPDNDNFELMKLNYLSNFEIHRWVCVRKAVTNHSGAAQLTFWTGSKTSDRYRTSIFPNKRGRIVSLPNIYAGNIFGSAVVMSLFDGVKMDIEGAELGLIDSDLIPDCKKLVMEYHITKDKSMVNFHIRMNKLREHFSQVLYMPSLDRFPKNGLYPGFFDRIIICKK